MVNTVANVVEAKPNNFNLFQEIEWPKPTEGKDTVVLSCDVYQDGVGDLVHFLEMSEYIVPKLKAQGFKVAGITYLGKMGESYYQRNKQRFDTLFDEMHINDNQNSNKVPQAQNAIDRAVCEFIISIGNSYTKNVRHVSIREYGTQNNARQFRALYTANMGLPSTNDNEVVLSEDDHPVYGIKFQPNPHIGMEPAELLLNINEEDFLRKLLDKPDGQLSLDDTKSYLNTHDFIPAYAQTPQAALLFIFTMLEKNMQIENPKIQDFFIPGIAMDMDILKQHLSDAGVQDFVLVKNGKEVVVGDVEKAMVRVTSHFIKEDHDYEALYNLGSKVTGVSGNSTFSTAIQTGSFPFVMWFGGMGGQFCRDFVPFCKNAQLGDEPAILYDFFHLLSKKTNSYYMAGCETMFNFDIACSINRGEDMFLKGKEAYFDVVKQLARMLNDPLLYTQFQRLQQLILRDYNYYNVFDAVAKGGIYMSQTVELGLTNPLVNEALMQATPIQNLLINGIVEESDLRSMPVRELEKLAEPFLNTCLVNRWITVGEATSTESGELLHIYGAKVEPELKAKMLKTPLREWIRNNPQVDLSAEALQIIQTDFANNLIKQGTHPIIAARPFIKDLIETEQLQDTQLVGAGHRLIPYLDQLEKAEPAKAAGFIRDFTLKLKYLDSRNLKFSMELFDPQLDIMDLTVDQMHCLSQEPIMFLIEHRLIDLNQVLRITPTMLREAEDRMRQNTSLESEQDQISFFVKTIKEMLNPKPPIEHRKPVVAFLKTHSHISDSTKESQNIENVSPNTNPTINPTKKK